MSHLKIVIAPDSFKESMTAKEVAQAIQQGFQEVWDNYITFDLILWLMVAKVQLRL